MTLVKWVVCTAVILAVPTLELGRIAGWSSTAPALPSLASAEDPMTNGLKPFQKSPRKSTSSETAQVNPEPDTQTQLKRWTFTDGGRTKPSGPR